jgi:hypothetical protein
LVFTGSDRGSGLAVARVISDGKVADEWVPDARNGLCQQPSVVRVPCVTEPTQYSRLFDTTKLSDGPHELRLVVYDATGVNEAEYPPAGQPGVRVVVDNGGGAASGGGSGASGGSGGGGAGAESSAGAAATSGAAGATPTAGSAPAGPAAPPAALAPSVLARIVPTPELSDGTVRVPFGRPVRVGGTLVDDLRRPIGGAELLVFAAADEPGRRPVLVGRATTTASGAFQVELPPGSSRVVSVEYRPRGEPVATLGAKVVVPASIALRASRPRLRNGQTLTLTARVRAASPAEARKAQVAFQVLIGRTWHTFARDAADVRGLAHASHRFRVTFTRIRYRFRAITLAKRGFPYAPGRSRTVSVLVN